MLRGTLSFVFAAFALVLVFAGPSFAQDDAMEGTVICVQVDEGGNVQTMTEFTECSGTIVMVGSEKAAAVVATKEEKKRWLSLKGGKQTVGGQLEGHTRGYILASSTALDEKGAKEASVSGALVCLLPNYEAGSVKPVVATGPCGEADPHLHVVTTGGGQVYAVHGSEESIGKLESLSDRSNVELKGQLKGSSGAWILVVN